MSKKGSKDQKGDIEDLESIPDLPSFESLAADDDESSNQTLENKLSTKIDEPRKQISGKALPTFKKTSRWSTKVTDPDYLDLKQRVAALENNSKILSKNIQELTEQNFELEQKLENTLARLSTPTVQRDTINPSLAQPLEEDFMPEPDVVDEDTELDPVDALENIPIQPADKQCKNFNAELEKIIIKINQEMQNIDALLSRSESPQTQQKKTMASGFKQQRVGGSLDIQKKQKNIIDKFVVSTQTMLSKLQDSSLTSSHILDYLEMNLALKNDQKELKVEKQSVSDSGPVIDLLNEAVMRSKELLRDLDIIDLTQID